MKFKLVESIDDRLVEYNSAVNNLPNKCGIYCYIFNVKDNNSKIYQKKYVGQATNILSRNKEHFKKSARREYIIYNAMNTHPDYEIIVLEVFDEISQKLLDDAEIKWIKKLHTYMYDTTKSDEIVTIEYNGKKYRLTCEGPGYNMTLGGSGGRKYSDKQIQDLIALYEKTNFNHTETLKKFKQLYQGTRFEAIAIDTFKTIALSLGLPWSNQQQGARSSEKISSKYEFYTITANSAKCRSYIEFERTKDGSVHEHNRYVYWRYPNQSSPKYSLTVQSTGAAYEIMQSIYRKIMIDLGDKLIELNSREGQNDFSKWLFYIQENNLYDKYFDLSQYEVSNINISKGPKVKVIGQDVKSCGGFFFIKPNINYLDDNIDEDYYK